MARDVLDIGPARAERLMRVMPADALEPKLPHVGCLGLVVLAPASRNNETPAGVGRGLTGGVLRVGV
jgi:hypothetical protein